MRNPHPHEGVSWGSQPTAHAAAPRLYSNGWWYWLGYAFTVPVITALAALVSDGLLYTVLTFTIVWGGVLGYRDQRLGLKFARGNYIALILLLSLIHI